MKNYITIAALLVAGSAFANAAYEDTYGTLGAGHVMAYWSFDSSEGFKSPTTDFTVVSEYTLPSWDTSESVLHNSTGGWLDSGYATFNGNGGPYATMKGSNSGNTNFGNATYSFFVKLSDASSGTILSITNANKLNVNADGTSIVFSAGNVSESYDLSEFANKWVNITFQTYHGEGTDVYVNGESQGRNTNIVLSGQGLSAQLGSHYASQGSGGKLNNASLDEVVMWFGAKPTAAQIKSYSIPEPSAFGLLAGLGALGLVGARRRRR